jgi:hypothetical protein
VIALTTDPFILSLVGVLCSLKTGVAIGARMGTFFLPFNFFTELFTLAAPYLPDWKTHNKNRH